MPLFGSEIGGHSMCFAILHWYHLPYSYYLSVPYWFYRPFFTSIWKRCSSQRFLENSKEISVLLLPSWYSCSAFAATGNRGFSFGIVVSEFVISIARRVIQSLFCMELKSCDVGMNETCSLPVLSVRTHLHTRGFIIGYFRSWTFSIEYFYERNFIPQQGKWCLSLIFSWWGSFYCKNFY